MNIKLRQQAVALTEAIMRTYYCERDIYGILDRMAPDASWIGPGEREKIYNLKEMQTYFELGKDDVPPCEISDVDLRAVDLGEDYCLVIGSMMIRTTPECKLVLEVDQRVSFTYRYAEGVFQVVHIHNSNPYGEMNREEYFPHKIGSQSYEYLQRLIKEKTDVIDMIAGNIDGGLKGSNDDNTFSYFYVNDGLPRMLDFTYEEFMEKTGGTAVGAVYPPDLPAALSDCERCFAQGPAYSTEYRMEKKDKSLIWVLDTGRKAPDSEGVMRINSIITDITPLKQALLDLEIERERYRVALENITGAMCEYDIEKDLFTVYQRSGENDGQEVEKLEFNRFSASVLSEGPLHPDDREAFLDLCTGRHEGRMELRTRFFHSEESWCWNEFSCSLVTDSTGVPMRSIGMLKDITEEKHKNLKLMEQARRDGLTGLLNQTAVKEEIQTYLMECGVREGRRGALLMVDLDRFKEVNDTKGHLYGNEVLIKTARILDGVTGAGCITGRSGGDEFIVLARDAQPEEAARMAAEIVKKVSEIGADGAFPISCSIGIACRFDGEENFAQFFGRADRALYQAKNSGRDRWSMDEERKS